MTHGGPILWLTRYITGAPYTAMGVFEVDPASVTLFQHRSGTWRLRLFNDTSHLRDPLLETSAPQTHARNLDVRSRPGDRVRCLHLPRKVGTPQGMTLGNAQVEETPAGNATENRPPGGASEPAGKGETVG